jgi:hypothetical protein
MADRGRARRRCRGGGGRGGYCGSGRGAAGGAGQRPIEVERRAGGQGHAHDDLVDVPLDGEQRPDGCDEVVGRCRDADRIGVVGQPRRVTLEQRGVGASRTQGREHAPAGPEPGVER